MTADLEELQSRLEYPFHDSGLLRHALTHKSRAYEKGAPAVAADNEQLEFLGDSILGFLVSEWLVTRFPLEPEGRLSKLKAHLVSAAHLHTAAQDLDLGKYLLLGRGEELSGGRAKKALLANAFEALIAAVYLDGGLDAARRLVVERVLSDFDPGEAGADGVFDFKGALQELTRTLKLPAPHYSIIAERGPEHAKTFVIEVRVGRDLAGQAQGVSKKSAGQEAARLVWMQLTAKNAD